MRKIFLTALFACCASVALAEKSFPPEGWQEKISPLADPHARIGGEFKYFAFSYPKSLNFYLEFSTSGEMVFSAMYENLLSINPLTLEMEPYLAKRWTISDDLKTFTFQLDPNAKWSDGVPLTARDVAFTYDMILNPTNLTGPWKADMERFDPPVVVDDHTIRFHAKEVHWKNLINLSSIYIMPAHALATQDFNQVNFELPPSSGPYVLGEIKEGFYSKLERRTNWWRQAYPSSQGFYNFSTLRFVYYQDPETAFDEFKKGKLDYYFVNSARRWVLELKGEKFEKNWIVKQRVVNRYPATFGGLAMNSRKPLFADKLTRKAMAHLMDRDRLNRIIMYDQYIMHRSYFEDLYNAQHPCTNFYYGFDKERARALLAEAGWKPNAKTGVLERNGVEFRFTFMARDASENRFLVIYQQDLKDCGIEMKIELKDWSAWMKEMDDFNFEMTWCSFSGSLFKDAESLWHSREAARQAGNNYPGLKDPRVDALIEKCKSEFDAAKRNDLLRELDTILIEECPYVMLWTINYQRIIYWNKFGMPPHILGAITDERGALAYWWYDPDAAADLKEARISGLPMPKHPFAVDFEKVFRP